MIYLQIVRHRLFRRHAIIPWPSSTSTSVLALRVPLRYSPAMESSASRQPRGRAMVPCCLHIVTTHQRSDGPSNLSPGRFRRFLLGLHQSRLQCPRNRHRQRHHRHHQDLPPDHRHQPQNIPQSSPSLLCFASKVTARKGRNTRNTVTVSSSAPAKPMVTTSGLSLTGAQASCTSGQLAPVGKASIAQDFACKHLLAPVDRDFGHDHQYKLRATLQPQVNLLTMALRPEHSRLEPQPGFVLRPGRDKRMARCCWHRATYQHPNSGILQCFQHRCHRFLIRRRHSLRNLQDPQPLRFRLTRRRLQSHSSTCHGHLKGWCTTGMGR